MLNRILRVIENHINNSSIVIDEESNIFDCGIDSLRMMKVIMEIEDLYNVKFYDREIVELRTALDIEKIILEKIS